MDGRIISTNWHRRVRGTDFCHEISFGTVHGTDFGTKLLVRYEVFGTVQNYWYGTRYFGTGILVQVFSYRYFGTGILVQVFWYFDTRILVQILVRMERGPRNEKNKYKTSFFERFFQIGIGPFIFPVFRNCSPNHVPYQKKSVPVRMLSYHNPYHVPDHLISD